MWWIISGGEAESWRWGLPAIIAASLVMPAPDLPLRPSAWLRLLPLALWLGLRGGVEVAWLASRPRMRLDTRLIEHRWLTLEAPAGRLFMASLINLLPGTLTIRIEHDRLQVHVLHYRDGIADALCRLERYIAPLFNSTDRRDEEAA
nr:Na+/H+ antiporter subunit E [Halomonas sp.]